ncbi:MAG: peptide ABC transporter ATP-binding protein [Acidimicrobiaceae bacterium]|nr:peptide ABC transporter ATP-binding protein [Acidimicrobiaceae bacterium]|tara:strand:- start:12086 stop:13102 length:1017 start_codon:yes stop_codon:yes gene_type:complete
MTPTIEVLDLQVTFLTSEGPVNAVNGVNFELYQGEILALVGESGSGKTVTSLALTQLLEAGRSQVAGSVKFGGLDLLKASQRDLRAVRATEIAYIFQDPISSLYPARTVGSQLVEILTVNAGLNAREARTRSIDLLRRVGIPGPERQMRAYPHQLSGGMCQRVMIAMALAVNPRVLIADEATSSLDVSIQAQILELIKDVASEYGMAVIFVTHDLGVVAGTADRVAVMYGGEVVESGQVRDLLRNPHHPYTQALIKSAPNARDESQTELVGIPGSLETRREFAKIRCQFAPRCSESFEICWSHWPRPVQVEKSHSVSCWLLSDEEEILATQVDEGLTS